MFVEILMEIRLLNTAWLGSGFVTERTRGRAVPENLVACFLADFCQGADTEYLQCFFVHVNQLIGLYIRNIYDFVDILKESPYITHSAALRILVWYFSGSELLLVVSISYCGPKVYFLTATDMDLCLLPLGH